MEHTGTKSMKDDDDTMCYRSELEAAVKAERGACAKVCERWGKDVRVETWDMAADDCAAAIRARGNA